jgi:hypothetical protein
VKEWHKKLKEYNSVELADTVERTMVKTTNKKTINLKVGDIVLFADLVDEVTKVIVPAYGDIAEIHVLRNGRPTWWFAGKDAYQTVLTNKV